MKALHFCWLALFGLNGCTDAPSCSFDVLQVARDPGSDRYATISARNCGATSDYATVVRVGRASESQSAAEEVFVADSDHGAAAAGGRGSIWMSIAWTAPGQLSVAYASQARVFKHVAEAEGASISYKAGEPFSTPPVP